MPLAPATRVGPYEILAPLGAGGMGEVYRARDTRLGREIAIKVLPAAFARDADRLARFEREAKAVAALSHPNILAIHDTGTDGGQTFVVTELLDGESLRDRLKAGALPVRKAVDIAVQIARGLAAAHAKGIVHRDLKPENVFVLEDGQVKILDFGLARQTLTGSGATETAAGITDPGVVMGTVGYMAPEQVRGQPIDARTDLFAFGAVLHEMLSGQRAFKRDTAAETMTAILKDEPPELGGSRADLSPALDRIVRHCLEKNPAERFQTARDVAFALETLSGSATSVTATAAARSAPRWYASRLAWLLAGPALLTAAIAGALTNRVFTRVNPVSFAPKTWSGQSIFNARFMPDGQSVVFSAASETSGSPELFIDRASALVPEKLGQSDTELLSVSSKGELAVLIGAAYFANDTYEGTLARMTADGAPRPWLEHVRGADWSPDGSTLAIVQVSNGASVLEYPIGHPVYRVTAGYLSDPRVSPDGASVAFMEHSVPGDNRGWLKIIDGAGRVRTLAGEFEGENGVAWSTDGHFIFFSAATNGPNSEALVVNATGTPSIRQALAGPSGMQVHDRSANGSMLVTQDSNRTSIRGRLPGEAVEREFNWLNQSRMGLLSHDRRFLVFEDDSVSAGPDYAAMVWDVSTSKVSRLGTGGVLGLSPDDKWVAALVSSKNQIVIYPVGPGSPITLERGPISGYRDSSGEWVTNTRLVVCGNERSKRSRCYRQDIQGGAPEPITEEGTNYANLAPDGRTVLVRTDTGQSLLGPLGGPFKLVPGLSEFDAVVGWGPDSQSPIIAKSSKPPMRIERVDGQSFRSQIVQELSPPDSASVFVGWFTQWIDGGRGYIYTYVRENSMLYVVSGVEGR